MSSSINIDDLNDIADNLKGSSKTFKTVIYGSIIAVSSYFIYSYFKN